jgi:PAS domain S-box-containing protein
MNSRTVLNSMNDGIMVIDAHDFSIVSINSFLLKKYRLKEEEVIGKKCFEVSNKINEPCYRRDELCPLLESAETGKYSMVEHMHFGKNGEKIYAEVSTSPIKDDTGKVVQVIHVTRDITQRKQVENALHESEEKFEKAFRSSPQALTITGLDDGRFIEVNASFTNTLGYNREEAIGNTTLELGIWITQEDRIRFDVALKENGFVRNVEVDIRTKNGGTASMLVSAELINVAGKACVLSTFYDITERKRMEEALRDNEGKYRNLVDNANEAILVVQDGWLKFVNLRAIEMTGYSERELMIMPFQGFIHPDDRDIVIENYKKRMKGEAVPSRYSFRILTIKGITKWMEIGVALIEWKGKPATLNFLTDITQRKRAEKALWESEDKYKSVITNMSEGFTFYKIIINEKNIPIDYEFIEVNAAFEQMTGLKSDQIVGKNVIEVMEEIGLDTTDLIGKYNNVALTGKELKLEGYSSVLKKWLYICAYSPNIGYFAVTFIDITERKMTDEKIRKSLKEKEVLLQEIHHRVKNNMQIVSSLLTLQSQNIEDKKYKDIFIDSQNRIQTMALIHEKLYQSKSIAQINFKEYIEGIVSNILESYCIKSNIKIDINIENIQINIDSAVPCGLIINELVTNSLKYAFPEGRQGKIQISLKSNDNNMIQLSISDDGIGISKDMDIRNTKSLGLHLVTALAEGQLQGKIILNREIGTEFQIIFSAK